MKILETEIIILTLEKDILIICILNINNDCNIEKNIETMIEGINNVYISYQKLNKKLGLLFDIRQLNRILPITSIWKISDFFNSKKDITEVIITSTSIITENNFLLSLIKTFNTFYKNIKPLKFTNDYNEGYNFIINNCNIDKEIDNKEYKMNNEITKNEITNSINNYTNN